MAGFPIRVRRRNTRQAPPFSCQPSGQEPVMPEHVYKVVELVGSSEQSLTEAIDRAVAKASETLRNIGWFEVTNIRGHVENGKVAHYQVTLKLGFTVEE
jgi:dodecin